MVHHEKRTRAVWRGDIGMVSDVQSVNGVFEEEFLGVEIRPAQRVGGLSCGRPENDVGLLGIYSLFLLFWLRNGLNAKP
jgi:hypothetical protein